VKRLYSLFTVHYISNKILKKTKKMYSTFSPPPTFHWFYKKCIFKRNGVSLRASEIEREKAERERDDGARELSERERSNRASSKCWVFGGWRCYPAETTELQIFHRAAVEERPLSMWVSFVWSRPIFGQLELYWFEFFFKFLTKYTFSLFWYNTHKSCRAQSNFTKTHMWLNILFYWFYLSLVL